MAKPNLMILIEACCNHDRMTGVKDTEHKKIKMEGVIVVFIPIVSVAVIGVLLIFYRKYTNDERMALIEKGADAKIFNLASQRSYGPLRFAFLMIGLGVGLLIGAPLEEARIMEEGVSYASMILIFGGIGLYYSHILESKKRKDEDKVE